ncbi:MAG: cysteine desulfurase [Firmicutes bacterium]|nr:cysteine desulfurase [Bacillota bacterium]
MRLRSGARGTFVPAAGTGASGPVERRGRAAADGILRYGAIRLKRVYLDNAASTQALESVADAVRHALLHAYGNPSSLHGMGLEAERIVEGARAELARALGVEPAELFFTSGGTEANNLALKGAARARARRGRHILVTPIEHDSVLNALNALKAEGFEVEYLPVDGAGRVDPDRVRERVRPDTVLVSIGAVNNEIGTVQPLAAVGQALAALGEERPLLHTDAVQALGKVPLGDVIRHVDLASFSAHKIHGPKGTGALYVRRGVKLLPLAEGGGQERGLRPGTENVPGIAGFGAALRELEMLVQAWPRMRALKEALWEGLRDGLDGVQVRRLGPPPAEAAPHILSVAFPGLRGEVVVHALEEHGVFASTGSACTSRDPRPSHVLKAVGLEDEVAQGAVRLSLSRFTTEEDVERAVAAFRAALPALWRFARLRGRGGAR